MESALTCMLEARHVSEDTLRNDNLKICDNYWSQLQMLLKKMLSVALCPTTNKSSANSQQSASNKSADAGKLRALYKMSLKYTEFSQLQVMQGVSRHQKQPGVLQVVPSQTVQLHTGRV
ncbi:hypothetical protein RND71_005942 [Anisodus tanguticus]|uniref:Uncharacterized protein n=1 Tax=Anisodus tanguticus TaxID=243964 RepID=A0AAE1VVU7_9SOLA|nr:hypothetical protein RND71_005942 [Anisodus tanguticus]